MTDSVSGELRCKTCTELDLACVLVLTPSPRLRDVTETQQMKAQGGTRRTGETNAPSSRTPRTEQSDGER